MSSYSFYDKEESKDRLKSAVITAIIWSLILLFVFTYTITQRIPEKKEVVTKMLINFGDNRNGNGAEEPASQDGSLAAKSEELPAEPIVESVPEKKAEPVVLAEKPAKAVVKDKIITGNNTKVSAPKVEKSKETKAVAKTTSTKSTPAKSSGTKANEANSKAGNGDGKGTAAIGNLIKGRGTKPGTQGTNGTTGNAGDPLGGDGNGDSKIGVDRKLIGFIPGTMGRGGAQPNHQCSASGTISIAYTVDKAGNVISAKRSGGISDNCVATTSVDWVKRYVKAEKANSSSTGVYKITF